MTIDFSQKAKAKQLHDFFQRAGRIYIVVDATADAVDVPEYLKGDPALRLAFNVRMPQAVYIRAEGVSSVLSFSGQTHDCFIPLQYIWGAYEPDGDLENGLIWEDNVPEVIRSALLAQTELDNAPETEAVLHDTEHTAADQTSTADQTNMTHEQASMPTRPTKTPHLRVVK